MWKIQCCIAKDSDRIDVLHERGYEPFAVSTDPYGDTIWFKKKVTSSVDKKNK